MECETETRHQPSEKTHKLKPLKHLIQSMSRKTYRDYAEDLITPKNEHSLEEKFSISKFFYAFIKDKKTDSTGIKTLKKNAVTSHEVAHIILIRR